MARFRFLLGFPIALPRKARVWWSAMISSALLPPGKGISHHFVLLVRQHWIDVPVHTKSSAGQSCGRILRGNVGKEIKSRTVSGLDDAQRQ